MKCIICGWTNSRKKDMSTIKKICRKCYESGDDLFPCPLCGKRAVLNHYVEAWSCKTRIHCVCGVELYKEKNGIFHSENSVATERVKMLAIKSWNTRVVWGGGKII